MNTIVHRTALITDPQARAKVDIELAAAVFVLHPTDCEAIELALSTVSAVEYQGLPFDPVARRLWGVPITLTKRRQLVLRTRSHQVQSASTPTRKAFRSRDLRRRTLTTGQRT